MASTIGQLTAAPAVAGLSSTRKGCSVRNRCWMSITSNSSSSSGASFARAAVRSQAADDKNENENQAVIVERMELTDGATMFIFGDESDLPQLETEPAAVGVEIDTKTAQDDTDEDQALLSPPSSAEFSDPDGSESPASEGRPETEDMNEGAHEESDSDVEEQVVEPSPMEERISAPESMGSILIDDTTSWVQVGSQPLNGDSVEEEEGREVRTKYMFSQSTSQNSMPAQPQDLSAGYSGSFTMSPKSTEPSPALGESVATGDYSSMSCSANAMTRDQPSTRSLTSDNYSSVSGSAVLVHPDDVSVSDLESKNLADLRSEAKELGITFSTLKKTELVHAIHAVRRYHAGEKGVLDEDALQALSPGELRDICAKHNMKGRTSASKAKMVEFLTDLQKVSGDIHNHSVVELRGLAKELGIRGYSNATRDELIDWLEF